MSHIPKWLLDEILADPYYKKCARAGLFGHECGGRITFDHCIIYGNKQLQKKWAILPVCEKGHGVGRFQDRGDLLREVHTWMALNRATRAELMEISKAIDYENMKDWLNLKYGEYKPITEAVINY